MTKLIASQREQAARHLFDARRAGQPGPRLPEACRPSELDDSLAIQRRVQELVGAATGGWKCSLPTAERAVSCAPIFAPKIARAPPCPVRARDGVVRIEPEVAFVLRRGLPARPTPYSEAEIKAAIAETRLVLEILDSRYDNPAAVTFPEVLADHVSNEGLFVGPVLDDAFSRPLEGFPITVATAATTLHERQGRHPDGHPLRPLVWLANFLASDAEIGGLKAREIVTTGSYAGALEVPVATPIVVQFGDLGTIAVEFSAT